MAIDRDTIIDNLSQVNLKSDSTGLIPAYGVMVQRLPANFWNKFTTKILKAAGDDLYEAAEGLLENAAAECGYHTGHGIINSEEFRAVVEPMIEQRPDDILYGLFSVISAWGWADTEVVELIPEEKMVIRAYDYYESDIEYQRGFSAYMLRGISRAFMDLVFGKPYPNGHRTFISRQTMGIEKGDPYGEFVVTRV